MFLDFLSQSCEEEMRVKYAIHLEKYEKTHAGGFRRIYPKEDNEERYKSFFNQSTSLCAETAASRARTELSRIQREEITTKQKELEQFRKKLSGTKPSKSDDVRPESPSTEKKAKPRSLSIGRRMQSVRIPLYTSKTGSRQDSGSTTPAEGGGVKSRQENHQEIVETVRLVARGLLDCFIFTFSCAAYSSVWGGRVTSGYQGGGGA